MKLHDFNKKNYANRALKENYQMAFETKNMSISDTRSMLKKVRQLALEAKQSPNFYKEHADKTYMKLVFMEQSLVDHYNKLLSKPRPKIVVENEEVEKSQVVLAAQDLCDSIQKMLEDIGQMQVKELPALVDSIESEIGVNEAQSYNEQVSGQLETLSSSLKEAFNTLKSARDGITGGGAGAAFDMDAGDDMGMDAGDDMGMDAGDDMGMELPDEGPEAAPEFPEAEPVSGVGRQKR